jgi:hypothetical protein
MTSQRVSICLRDLPVSDYNEHAAKLRSFTAYGSSYLSHDSTVNHSQHTGTPNSHSPAMPISADGNAARGVGTGSRMVGHDFMIEKTAWIEEQIPNQPAKQKRWWRDRAHKESGKKPVRAWPAVLAELRQRDDWVEPAASATPAHSRRANSFGCASVGRACTG